MTRPTALTVLAAIIVTALFERAAGAALVSESAAPVTGTKSADSTTLERWSGEPPAAGSHTVTPQHALRPDRRVATSGRGKADARERGRTGDGNKAALLKALNAPAHRTAMGRPREPRGAALAKPSSGARLPGSAHVPQMHGSGPGAATPTRVPMPTDPVGRAPLSQRPPPLATLGGPARIRQPQSWEWQPRYAIRH